MSSKDIYHRTVRIALEKEGWLITHEPYEIMFKEPHIEKDLSYKVDFGAENLLAAEKQGRKIAILEVEPDRKLFLAVPEKLKKGILQYSFIKKLVNVFGVNFIIFNPNNSEVIEWIG